MFVSFTSFHKFVIRFWLEIEVQFSRCCADSEIAMVSLVYARIGACFVEQFEGRRALVTVLILLSE